MRITKVSVEGYGGDATEALCEPLKLPADHPGQEVGRLSPEMAEEHDRQSPPRRADVAAPRLARRGRGEREEDDTEAGVSHAKRSLSSTPTEVKEVIRQAGQIYLSTPDGKQLLKLLDSQISAAMTAVRLQTAPVALTVAFGSPTALHDDQLGKTAVFGPNKVVAYLARHPPYRALYLFRTAPPTDAATQLRYVSEPVNLLYVATTRRTVDKATVALNALQRRLGGAAVDALPDLFWHQLADFIERRGSKIVYFVSRLLERARRGF